MSTGSDYFDGQASRDKEIDALRAELDEAWKAAGVPVRGMVPLAEVIENLRESRDALRKAIERIDRERAVIVDAAKAIGVYFKDATT